MIRLAAAAAAALAALTPALAAAQEGAPAGFRLRFEAGPGVSVKPGYFGSDEYVAGPTGSFTLGYFRLGGLEVDDPDWDDAGSGFGFRTSLRYIGPRRAEDFSELQGLDDIDFALEVGGGVTYAEPNWEVFADARYGALGHEAFVAETGMDVIARPARRLELRAGPRLFFGDDDYAATYFGVTAAEAARSSYPAFDARGGLLSAGIEASADYLFNDLWGIEAKVEASRLMNDAAASPISIDDDQFSVSLIVTRRFDWRF